MTNDIFDLNYYNFDLPQDRIAQTPLLDRTSSKLMLLDRKSGDVNHKEFKDIVDILDDNDVLVFNNTRVIPARLFGTKKDTNANIEVLLLSNEGDTWETLCKPAKRVKIDTIISFGDDVLQAKCIEIKDDGMRVFEFIYDGVFLEKLSLLGEMPLPPYITEKLEDPDRYQTVYSKVEGSAAAPTAGLHFTDELINKLQSKGVKTEFVTLHVGLGTFRPVAVDNVKNHKMHEEYFVIDKDTSERLNDYKKLGKRIISVGTTTTRVLETCYDNGFNPMSGKTDIFIYPGYEFKAIDALFTNFHLPKSTLLMLVSALSSRDNIINAYNQAIKENYRFFSFGDSMFIS